MKLERAIVEILFNDISPQYIIDYLIRKNKNYFDDLINFKIFYFSSTDRLKDYSQDEIEKIYYGIKKDKIRNGEIDYDNPKTFFKYLGKFTNTLLVYNEYEPRIDYNYLMRWNEISHLLGQDILTMSFLAYHDYLYGEWTEFFAYKAVISTNNRQLFNILEQGLAENHFHLKGSSHIFCLNWISLMNHPTRRNKQFDKFDIKLKPYNNFDSMHEYGLYDLIKLAAILRLYFFIRTTNYEIEKKLINTEKLPNIINLDSMMTEIAQNNYLLDEYIKKIDSIKWKLNFKSKYNLDYALLGNLENNNHKNSYFAGERKIIYLTIRMMLSNEMTRLESVYFYLYISIKNSFRRELIQVNEVRGYRNFSNYENRKEIFIKKYPKYMNALIKGAIRDCFLSQKIISLEVRISPKKTAKDNIEYIKYLDNLCAEYKDKIFYVIHFVKKKDTLSLENGKFGIKRNVYNCRNYNVRKEIEHQGRSIAEALEANYTFRNRLKGIDACNNEYFCRPEVFGQIFRFLSNLHINDSRKKGHTPIEIYKTFHVGEDFLDISDGLRAIDEAILFCNLSNGSRLGHATVLGIDVDEYYKYKRRIYMTKLEFIDNIIWLLKKAEIININLNKYPCCKELLSKAYLIMDYVYGEQFSSCDQNDYYRAWQLRGDNPRCYNADGSINNNWTRKYDNYNLNGYIQNNIRTTQAKKLYYAYHFSKGVRIRGEEAYDFEIVDDYIKLIKEVQKYMQFEISRKGIFIECNPTSNYLIANLRRYHKHPIINFYNYELYNGLDKNCAQLNVSINTDDQGIFDTSLENEFALMAYSLENFHEDGKYKFTPNQVYKWIDSVRKMGIEQKFK